MEATYGSVNQNPESSIDTAATRGPAQKTGLRALGLALAVSLVVSGVVAACGSEAQLASPPGVEGKLRVVTTTALLADLVRNVGGNLVEVRSIVPAGADVHSFQTTPEDSIAVSRAQVIVSNGYGLDDFLTPVLQSAKDGDAVHLIATENIVLGHAGQNSRDPHFWLNPDHAVVYVDFRHSWFCHRWHILLACVTCIPCPTIYGK